MNNDPVYAHLATQIANLGGGELAEDATNAERGLEQVARFFRGTPFEKTLVDAMRICAKVSTFIEENNLG
jgi:hypothetical protein